MKMVIAIVQDKDVGKLLESVTRVGLRATRLASSGGFLRSGNTTLLFGVEEARLEGLLSMIRETCHQREEMLTQAQPIMGPVDAYIPFPIEVPVGGATVFVLDVEQFIKV
ncbi:MAG TPA: cyclic-di-AMP receptor [Desulfosporosinus sp.]